MNRRLDKLAVLNRVLSLRETRALQRVLTQRQQTQREDAQTRQLETMQADYRNRLQADEGDGLTIGNLRLGRRFDEAMADAVDGQTQRERLSHRDLAPVETAWRQARARRRGGEELLSRRRRDKQRHQARRERGQLPPRRGRDEG